MSAWPVGRIGEDRYLRGKLAGKVISRDHPIGNLHSVATVGHLEYAGGIRKDEVGGDIPPVTPGRGFVKKHKET